MGCGKSSHQNQPQADEPGEGGKAEKDRRRLTVSKAEAREAEKTKSDGKGGANTPPPEGSLLELFPHAERKVSVSGQVTSYEFQQKGYADKKEEKSGGPSALTDLRIGYACKKGLKPESPNQDDFCIYRADSTALYGVFDGHGPYGHDISNFVHDSLPKCFVRDANFEDDPVQAISSAFPRTHQMCVAAAQDGQFDCALSGTTATLAVHRKVKGEETLIVAHVGDSRAVLARGRNDELRCEDLTEDHKPDCEVERRRITSSGGQVRRLEGDIPFRVFLAGKMYPGLAMTRSIGDTVGTSAGVTSTPDVRKFAVQKDWRFLLLCSDGIWEFITSKEAVDIIGRFQPSEVQKAAEALALEAWNRWIKEEVNVVDDITVICAWINEEFT